MRVAFNVMKAEFKRVLLNLGFTDDKAGACAYIFAQNSLDGIYTHGLNRFPVFVQYVKDGYVNPCADMEAEDGFGLLERWNGNLGPGMLNARLCMERAIALAGKHGIGCVTIRNTNHWMRGGTYGWQAAEADCIGICFTNTIANLPPWGGTEPRLGNNPLVIAVPRTEGHVVLDMALSQYSYGKLLQYDAANEDLPLPGGYDVNGELSLDAGCIIDSGRLLPVGFWKGSGLSMVLDMLVTILSAGRSTADITKSEAEYGVSQVFICIKPGNNAQTDAILEQIIAYTKTSQLQDEVNPIRYPGESTLRIRHKNMEEGIPVDEQIWKKVLEM